MLACALAAYPALEAGKDSPAVDALAGLGVAFTLVATITSGRLTGAALMALGAAYAVIDLSGEASLEIIVAYAPGLAVLGELLLALPIFPTVGLTDPRSVTNRLLGLGAFAAASSLLAAIMLAAGRVELPTAFAAALLGSIAATTLITIPLILLRHRDG